MKLVLIALFGLSLSLVRPAEAAPLMWGEYGHRIVCEIALQNLSADERAAVRDLVREYRYPGGGRYSSFPAACLFADFARRQAQTPSQPWDRFGTFDNWHFLNVPRDTREVSEAFCDENCVLHGIAFHAERLADGQLEKWERAEALIFLGHWVGDLHQPLHISFADDRGGNSVRTSGLYGSMKLHAVWDSGIIERAMGPRGWRRYANDLYRAVTPEQAQAWRSGTPVEWAQESYLITTQPDVRYCAWEAGSGGDCAGIPGTRRLNADYQTEFQDDVERRLQQAGVRLAALLQQAL